MLNLLAVLTALWFAAHLVVWLAVSIAHMRIPDGGAWLDRLAGALLKERSWIKFI